MIVLINGVNVAHTPQLTLIAQRLTAPLRSVVVRLVDSAAVIDGQRLLLKRGPYHFSLRLTAQAQAVYSKGGDPQIPLEPVVQAMHERLGWDAHRSVVNIWIPRGPTVAPFRFMPGTTVVPQVIFTPTPLPRPRYTVPPGPRRTPIPAKIYAGDMPIAW